MGQAMLSPTDRPSSALPTGASTEMRSAWPSTSFGYTSVRQNSSLFSTVKRTVEFIVTTVGGISCGSSTSARPSSSSKAALSGDKLFPKAYNNASSRSRSCDDKIIFGFFSKISSLIIIRAASGFAGGNLPGRGGQNKQHQNVHHQRIMDELAEQGHSVLAFFIKIY